VRAYIKDRLGKGYANAAINRELSALKWMFNLAKEASRYVGDVPHIPMLTSRDFVNNGKCASCRYRARRDRRGAAESPVEVVRIR
jgi:hypothetical protein